MTHLIRPLLAAAALLTLAACSATNVGESWQCPLAQAQGCSTVAEADPALPRETLEPVPMPGSPLYRPRGADAAKRATDGSCGGDCGGGFDPLGWLAGVFETIAGDGEEPSPGAAGVEVGNARAENAATADAPAVAGARRASSILSGSPATTTPAASTGAGAPGPLPAGTAVGREPGAASAIALPPTPVADDADLREPEVIGRIWIAPFVDADGHYREGAWVRTVLEPAGWRLR